MAVQLGEVDLETTWDDSRDTVYRCAMFWDFACKKSFCFQVFQGQAFLNSNFSILNVHRG